MEEKKFSRNFDHTLLKADATKKDIVKLCRESIEYGFHSVCIHPCYLNFASDLLKDTSVSLCTVCGFPLGANDSLVKSFEAEQAVINGAQEIDMVINIGYLKDRLYQAALKDIQSVVNICGKDIITKVIIETALLTDMEIVEACQIVKEAGADFVKTSTGFASAGATVHHVSLMKKTVGNELKIKASGGIKTLSFVESLLKAGAERIGSSASVDIMKEYLTKSFETY